MSTTTRSDKLPPEPDTISRAEVLAALKAIGADQCDLAEICVTDKQPEGVTRSRLSQVLRKEPISPQWTRRIRAGLKDLADRRKAAVEAYI